MACSVELEIQTLPGGAAGATAYEMLPRMYARDEVILVGPHVALAHDGHRREVVPAPDVPGCHPEVPEEPVTWIVEEGRRKESA